MGGMITIKSSGSFAKIEKFLAAMNEQDLTNILTRYGQIGLRALIAATPRDSGATANAWSVEVSKARGGPTITWKNSNTVNGTPLVIMLVYGHGTGTGGWVEGRDFINPTIQPLFDQIANEVWEQVIRA